MTSLEPIEWSQGAIRLLDQTRLPWEEVFLELRTPQEVVQAIREMRVRGAPAIGVTAAYGMALAAGSLGKGGRASLLVSLRAASREMAAARPTAVNLRWAVERMMRAAEKVAPDGDMGASLLAEAQLVHRETLESDLRMAALGALLIQPGSTVLTHCNTGALATGGYGTALGVIRRAWEEGRVKGVVATETRPWLQGARLTTWELTRLGIPFTLIVDSAAGYLMSRGSVQCAIVGADRIAANGDVANKIGTCSLAMLARENGIPFYVAAPFSTVDMSTASGEDIPIEERPSEEVTHIRGTPTALEGTPVRNFAFDVTPSRYIGAIITDRGVVRAPYEESLRRLVGSG
ncbi:MAG: putative translation initiation factor subunit [Dehalococcoidia bacterium]|nr:putative translation initiation factor subunit [Dehalococcoidia bacterium]